MRIEEALLRDVKELCISDIQYCQDMSPAQQKALRRCFYGTSDTFPVKYQLNCVFLLHKPKVMSANGPFSPTSSPTLIKHRYENR